MNRQKAKSKRQQRRVFYRVFDNFHSTLKPMFFAPVYSQLKIIFHKSFKKLIVRNIKYLNPLSTKPLLLFLNLLITTGLLITFTYFLSNSSLAFVTEQGRSDKENLLANRVSLHQKAHPLPPSLAQWKDEADSGDYFKQIQPTKVGYLIWSQFPVKISIETPELINKQQTQNWVNQVSQTIQEWNQYLPLEIVKNSEIADIKILRQRPPLQIDPETKIPRARSALTTYQLYEKNDILSHKFVILLSPSQTGKYLQAASRHELGHALGIWGHSPVKTDALYFSQVREPASISPRDVNTLKKVYQQSTSLGWTKIIRPKMESNNNLRLLVE